MRSIIVVLSLFTATTLASTISASSAIISAATIISTASATSWASVQEQRRKRSVYENGKQTFIFKYVGHSNSLKLWWKNFQINNKKKNISLYGSGQSESTRAPPPEPTYMRKQLDARWSLHIVSLHKNFFESIFLWQTATAPDGIPLSSNAWTRCNARRGLGWWTSICCMLENNRVLKMFASHKFICRLPCQAGWWTRWIRLGSLRTSTLTSASRGSQFAMQISNYPLPS